MLLLDNFLFSNGQRTAEQGSMLRAMEIELTIEDAQGEMMRVSATGPDYDTAMAAAKAKISEGSRAIVIRVADREA